MTPFMISLQVNASVIDELKIERSRMEQREKLYMSAVLFQQYIATVLVSPID
jgi:hypothetical protein